MIASDSCDLHKLLNLYVTATILACHILVSYRTPFCDPLHEVHKNVRKHNQ